MPIYEYECGECGHRLESIQKVNEAPLTDCPSCGKVALKRLLSAAGFQLKGSGWYATDFKNNGRKKDAGKDTANDKGEASSSSSSSEGGGDAAPEKKAHGCGGGACGHSH